MAGTTVRERMSRLCESDDCADVEFIVRCGTESETVKGHKPIFAVSSEVFEKMLFGDKATSVVVIDDVQPSAFLAMKKFIYTDVIVFESVEQARAIYELAVTYKLDRLIEETKKYLLANVKT